MALYGGIKKSDLVYPGERLDDLHRKGYQLIQNPRLFCFGCDAVLLSGFATVKKNESALDLGTGNGVIPILLCGKTEGAHFVGLEIQEQNVDLARRSVAYNQLEGKIHMIQGDIRHITETVKPGAFDVVTSNPPYMNEGGGLLNAGEAVTIARHELLCTLEEVVRAAAYALRPGGRFYMVHRPARLVDIMVSMRAYKMEPKQMRLVHPFVHKEPTHVLVAGVKGGKPMLKTGPPLILYREPGVYTEEVQRIYYE